MRVIYAGGTCDYLDLNIVPVTVTVTPSRHGGVTIATNHSM